MPSADIGAAAEGGARARSRSCRSACSSTSGAGRCSRARSRPRTTTRRGGTCKLKYQGVAPPSPRGEEFFDPGAKYHVPANTPYARYFLAARPAVPVPPRAGEGGRAAPTPLHRCSIYGSKEAGEKLKAMLEMGASKPWPDALEALTGSARRWTRRAIADYFAPLKAWLDEQNKGKPVGW